MASVRPHFVPIPTQDAPGSGRLTLRDGMSATIRAARPSDLATMANFFASLSKQSRLRRFFSHSLPDEKIIISFCDASDARKQLTLVVTQLVGDVETIIAVGSYVVIDANAADIGLAVADTYQGKGIGTLLLERLALIAAVNGIRHFWAMTMFENQPMIDVFRKSGFACRTKADQGVVEIDLDLTPSAASVTHAELRDRVSTAASLRPFFQPRSVAIVGASRNPANIGTRLLQAAVDAGFRGPLYPINPKATAIGSLRAYPSVRDIPEAPDLAVIAVPRDAVMGVVDDCAARGRACRGRHHRGICRDRRRRARAATAAFGKSAWPRHAHGRVQTAWVC